MAFDHVRVVRIGKVEFGEVARAKGDKMVAIGFMQHAFATDLMDLDLAFRPTDRDFATQGVTVVHAADCRFHMGGLAGMVMVKAEGRDKPLIHIQARGLGYFTITIPVLNIKRPGQCWRCKAGTQHGDDQGPYGA